MFYLKVGRVVKLELAVSCNLIRSSGATLSLKLERGGRQRCDAITVGSDESSSSKVCLRRRGCLPLPHARKGWYHAKRVENTAKQSVNNRLDAGQLESIPRS